jgi:hypothetical protein
MVWDGTEYSILSPLFESGQLPNLARVSPTLHHLRSENPKVGDCGGMLTTTKPQHATMLTGYLADVHHVYTNYCYEEIPQGLTVPERLEAANSAIVTIHIASKLENTGLAIFKNLAAAVDYFAVNDMPPAQAVNLALAKLPLLVNHDFFLFLHSREPDHTGHINGFDSHEYQDALLEDDRQLGRVLDALTKTGLINQTTIYVLADHGFGDSGKENTVAEKVHFHAPNTFMVTNNPFGHDLRMSEVAGMLLSHFR